MLLNYEYDARLAVRHAIEQGPTTIEQILRACRGIFPAKVLQLANDQGISIPAYTETSSREHPEELAIDRIPGNPVLCSWYFTKEAINRLKPLMDYSERNIAFLGCPKLFASFCEDSIGKTRTLFEFDRYVISILKTTISNGSIVEYDLSNPIPTKWHQHFDVIFFDPPWYLSEYLIWISQAALMTVPSGLVAFSLFPELTRPNAISDRASILNAARSIDPDTLLLEDMLSYTIPSFERAQLARCGLTNLYSWKSSDLVILHKKTVLGSQLVMQAEQKEWSEVILGPLRIFVRKDSYPTAHLLEIPPGGPYLASPSRREAVRQSANILTSDGRAFYSNDEGRLLVILNELSTKTLDEIMSKHNLDLDSYSALAELIAH